MLRGELVDQLDNIEAVRSEVKVGFQRQEAFDGLSAGNGIDAPPPCQGNLAVSQQFEVPGQLALGFSKALGKALYFPQVGSVKGENRIRLPQLRLLDDNGFCLVTSWTLHVFALKNL